MGTDIYIFSDTGLCFYREKANTTSVTIDVSRLVSGRYYLKIGKTGKVIIKR
ncbi:MAG: hypothetical protein LBH12_05075 [Dysgonamonadaceae bacterium]|nr:hypothetical protein [Dysgonamonadaceae bacterium]